MAHDAFGITERYSTKHAMDFGTALWLALIIGGPLIAAVDTFRRPMKDHDMRWNKKR